MIPAGVKRILDKHQVTPDQRILVALSGGADSMALLNAFLTLGYTCEAAHCNFHLRGDESDEDERFVTEYCREKQVPLYIKHFDTQEEARQKGISIEMAARDLRYQWFWELVEENGFSQLATGHHGDDMIETFFLNLARGTGVRGLRGMREYRGVLLRPLLAFRREEIEVWCCRNEIPFRTDSSNLDTAYQRNYIRHNILPEMEQLNPSFFSTMQRNFKNIDDVWQVFMDRVEELKQQILAHEGEHMLIPIRLISEHPQREVVLFEILRPYGFKGATISEIIESFDGIPGKQFFSQNYRLVRDRYNLILLPRETGEEEMFYIENGLTEVAGPLKMSIKQYEANKDFKFSRDPRCIHLDADCIDFPLKVRHWQQGDLFRPLGMEKFKKLSDFFVDEKLSRVEKDKVWLLLSGDDIVWVAGHRIDDRFKVTNTTKNILEIRV
ncbi:tRNA lysidine(34) synthetase TilS [Marinilabilia salmonicolor]|uniref:tRNA lysidine(34) synthetase TilS n=1 Tax=Marinilabilia salmonicolor TaxID=989 RepID=UPI00029ABCE3|nr:tRNA lysidine(34) synthetase TilS [Marinilabilia salmonicolor]